MKKYFPVVFLALCFLFTSACQNLKPNDASLTRQEVRQEILDLVSQRILKTPDREWNLSGSMDRWRIMIRAYDGGELRWQSETASTDTEPLKEALYRAVDQRKQQLPGNGKPLRLWVSVEKENGDRLTIVDYRGHALEGAGDAFVAIRKVDKTLISRKIEDSRKYLLYAMDPKAYGFHKLYNSMTDTYEDRVRTIYSASSLWTLMKINDLKLDPEIQRRIPKIADFLLSMQIKTGPMTGAFYYSLDHGRKRRSFTVGTASKTIFTLLDLNRRFGDDRYLKAAMDAGDWLLRSQNTDGTVTENFEFFTSGVVKKTRFSWLYHGQVLSALSRLYGVTGDPRYLNGAAKIEKLVITRSRDQNFFLKDEYRTAIDPVPTAWGVMSLLDYIKVTHDGEALETLWKLVNELLLRQQQDPGDIWDYGRFAEDTFASSNGWINEVFSEVYRYGNDNGWDREQLAKIRESIILVTRWLIQNTYSPENSYDVKNPVRAIGGLPRNFALQEVRTDAVCHGVNGYLNMLAQWPNGTLLDVPEEEFFAGTSFIY